MSLSNPKSPEQLERDITAIILSEGGNLASIQARNAAKRIVEYGITNADDFLEPLKEREMNADIEEEHGLAPNEQPQLRVIRD